MNHPQGDASPLRSKHSSSVGESPSSAAAAAPGSTNSKNRRRRRKPKSNSTGTTIATAQVVLVQATTPPRSSTTTSTTTTTTTTPTTSTTTTPATTSTDFDDFFFSTPKKSLVNSNIQITTTTTTTTTTPEVINNYNHNSHQSHFNDTSGYRHSNSNNSNRSGGKHSNNLQHQHHNQQHHSHHQQHHQQHHHHHRHPNEPADMTVIVNRVDLWDAASKFISPDDRYHNNSATLHAPHCAVAPYHFAPDMACWLSNTTTSTSSSSASSSTSQHTVAVVRVPYAVKFQLADPSHTNQATLAPAATTSSTGMMMEVDVDHTAEDSMHHDDSNDGHQRQDSGDNMIICDQQQQYQQYHPVLIDTSIPNPHGSIVDKYWAQRRRLFSRFDLGIQLDEEGWYSVTPEIIADHVAHRVGELSKSTATFSSRGLLLPGSRSSSTSDTPPGIVILDAFCGCGGNSIAFGKIPAQCISLVICVDVDRTKLRKAAHNASLYDIPKDKLIFVECNTMFLLQYCYKNGDFVLDQPSAVGTVIPSLPSPVLTEVYDGYTIGGLNVLPRRIDAVFMDPPWGGVDYEVLGKNGYDLFLNMKIAIEPGMQPDYPSQQQQKQHQQSADATSGVVSDDFFDSFGGCQGGSNKKKQFNNNQHNGDDGKKFVNGAQLLQLAAAATTSRLVIYDLPRNTNKNSLGQAALDAGYRGNIKLEEHWLNGRLKTVTAYFGGDYSSLLQLHHHQQQQQTHESSFG